MNRHLVAIEVSVKGGTDQRVQLNGAAFDQHSLKGLNAQAVQCGSAVQEHWMVFNDLFQHVPDLGFHTLDKAFRALDVVREVLLYQFAHDKGLEEFQRHFLGQSALVQFQVRPDHDHRAAGVVYALTEQVLAETTLFALEHVREALELVVARTGHGAATATIVDQGIAGFLQHTLFVANDDFRRPEFQQPLEAVVAVNHAPVEIVQVGRGEAATVELHHRA